MEGLSLEDCVGELGRGGLHLMKASGFVSKSFNFQSPYHEMELQIPPPFSFQLPRRESGLGILGPKRKYLALVGLRSLWS